MSSILLQLDRKIPLVNATFRYANGSRTKSEAIRILEAAENEHQLYILYSSGGFLRPGGYLSRYSKNISLKLLSRQLNNDTNADAYEQFSNHYDYNEPDNAYLVDYAIQSHLYPFLSATSLILEGVDFAQEHLIVFEDKLIWSFSPYEWGKVVADWANETKWNLPLTDHQSVHRDLWNPSDFYWGLDGLIADYTLWSQTVREILLAKSAKYF